MNHKITKNQKKIFLFLIGLALIFTAGSAAVMPKDYEAYNIASVTNKISQVNQEAENSLDVVFLGDSECSYTFAPVQLYGEYGIASYNLGFANQHFCDSIVVLKETMKKQDVRMIVLECNLLFLPGNPIDPVPRDQYWFEKLVPMAHYHSFYKRIDLPRQLPAGNDISQQSAITKGFYIRRMTNAYKGDREYMKHTPDSDKDTKITPENEKAVKELADLCKEKNIQLVLSAAPSPLSWNYQKLKTTEELAEKLQVPFVDFNQPSQVSIDWAEDTMDAGDHINFMGSLKVNHYMGEWIRKNADLPDHRSDESYESWDKLYQKHYGGGR